MITDKYNKEMERLQQKFATPSNTPVQAINSAQGTPTLASPALSLPQRSLEGNGLLLQSPQQVSTVTEMIQAAVSAAMGQMGPMLMQRQGGEKMEH